MKTTLYSPDVECDSCVKVLSRALKKTPGVQDFEVGIDAITIQHDKTISASELLKTIQTKGYRAYATPEMRPKIRDRAKDFLSNKEKYRVEHTLVRNTVFGLLFFLLIEYSVLLLVNRTSPGAFALYFPWLTYLTVGVIAIGGAIWHFKSYRATVTCMTGMMIGMTIGMQTGMMVGAVIGVTNGFFTGAMTGMLLGSLVGAWTGNCCGIMGIMEGIMAGVMGGTMGAMITVMMFYDNIHWFMPFYMGLNLLILVGFSYMLFEELVEGKDVEVSSLGFWPFIAMCALVLAGLTALVLLAPPSIFLGVTV